MSNEQPHDPTITLRLELGRVTDQRNAYEAALRKEVLVVIREAIAETGRMKTEVIRMSDTIGCMAVEVDDLRKENAMLHERIDNLVIKNNDREAEYMKLESQNARLKAEVERLKHAIVAGQAIIPDAKEVQS